PRTDLFKFPTPEQLDRMAQRGEPPSEEFGLLQFNAQPSFLLTRAHLETPQTTTLGLLQQLGGMCKAIRTPKSTPETAEEYSEQLMAGLRLCQQMLRANRQAWT
ncbi:MAG: hypothetical protein ACK55Z_22675, partial [bacterium]